jgi:hypothetical protein
MTGVRAEHLLYRVSTDRYLLDTTTTRRNNSLRGKVLRRAATSRVNLVSVGGRKARSSQRDTYD